MNKHKDWEITQENDRLKEKIAESKGYKIIRFWESEIKSSFDEIKNKVKCLAVSND